MKICCWNCNHCCTFASVCFKGKFNKLQHKIELDEYNCPEFESENKNEKGIKK